MAGAAPQGAGGHRAEAAGGADRGAPAEMTDRRRGGSPAAVWKLQLAPPGFPAGQTRRPGSARVERSRALAPPRRRCGGRGARRGAQHVAASGEGVRAEAAHPPAAEQGEAGRAAGAGLGREASSAEARRAQLWGSRPSLHRGGGGGGAAGALEWKCCRSLGLSWGPAAAASRPPRACAECRRLSAPPWS